jgi:hypothetical protein
MAWVLRIASRLVPTPVVEYFLKKSAPKLKEAKKAI